MRSISFPRKVLYAIFAISAVLLIARPSETLSTLSTTLESAKSFLGVGLPDLTPKGQIETAIKTNHIAFFSKSYCPFCKKAKALFAELDQDPAIFELDLMEDGAEWQAYLAERTGQRTVPAIFIGRKFIGGSSDLEQKYQSGELGRLLKGK